MRGPRSGTNTALRRLERRSRIQNRKDREDCKGLKFPAKSAIFATFAVLLDRCSKPDTSARAAPVLLQIAVDRGEHRADLAAKDCQNADNDNCDQHQNKRVLD